MNKTEIHSLLEGKVEVVKLDMFPIRTFEKFLIEQFGFNKLETVGDETNGWQVDFFYTFNHPQKGDYTLSGSLHYGNYKFSKAD